jgi:hypothetical protein
MQYRVISKLEDMNIVNTTDSTMSRTWQKPSDSTMSRTWQKPPDSTMSRTCQNHPPALTAALKEQKQAPLVII